MAQSKEENISQHSHEKNPLIDAEDPQRISNGGVLAIALVVAVVFWVLWVYFGIKGMHEFVEKNVVDLSTPSSEVLLLSTTARAVSPTVATAISPTVAANGSKAEPQLLLTREAHFAEIGQTGDAFGGLNTLLTALAGAFVFWAGFMQHQALKHAQRQARVERAARIKQAEDSRRSIELAEQTAASAESANHHARNSYIASQRAWVHVIDISSKKFSVSQSHGAVEGVLSLNLGNIGNSPALNVRVKLHGQVYTLDEKRPNFQATINLLGKTASDAIDASPAMAIFPNEKTPTSVQCKCKFSSDASLILISLICDVSYQIVGDGENLHRTILVYDITYDSGFGVGTVINVVPKVEGFGINAEYIELKSRGLAFSKSSIEAGYVN